MLTLIQKTTPYSLASLSSTGRALSSTPTDEPIKKPGNDLLSHPQGAVPSARQGLTSVFGMGTGGSPALWSPGSIHTKEGTPARQPERGHETGSEVKGYRA